MKRLTYSLVFLILSTLACNLGGLFASPPTASSPTPAPTLPHSPAPTLTLSPAPATEDQTLVSLSLVKKVAITTEAEGGSARPEIAATADRVFVLYLGNIGAGNARTFSLKIYDANLDAVIASKVLVATTPEYGGPTDIRVASDGESLYAFYETADMAAKMTYLWGAKYRLADDFPLAAATNGPIAQSKTFDAQQEGDEKLDDPAPLIGPNSVFVVTRIETPLGTPGQTIYRVREFSRDLQALISEFDLDLSARADGRARVTSLLYWNDRILMALATTVSEQGIHEGNDDGALSDIVLIRMRPDWTFDPQSDVHTLAAEPDDRENYVSGFETDGSYFYLTYKQSIGQPPSGEHVGWIKIFDKDFNAVHAERVKSTVWGPGGGEMRPSLEVSGNRLFFGQSGGQGLGQGNAEVEVYQINATNTAPPPSGGKCGDGICFIPDPGLRIDNASNASVGIDPSTGTIYLYYLDRAANRNKVATAEDGLNFGEGIVPTTYAFDSHNVLLPDGTWRRYSYDNRSGQMTSMSSTDGLHFTPDDGVRYAPQEDDKGTLGVYDFHVTASGTMVMVYLGDLPGLNNLRRAVSTDNGWTFTFDRADLLGDAALGGGSNSFVDPKLIELPDGRVRLIAMKQGSIYSFIADDNLETFTQELGARLSPTDFTEFSVMAFFDPVVVRLPDGRYRMFMTAGFADSQEHQALVSATTP